VQGGDDLRAFSDRRGDPLDRARAHVADREHAEPARLERSLVTDVTGIKKAGELAFVRPMFQGKLTADVVPLGPPPHLVTCQKLGSASTGNAVFWSKSTTWTNVLPSRR